MIVYLFIGNILLFNILFILIGKCLYDEAIKRI